MAVHHDCADVHGLLGPPLTPAELDAARAEAREELVQAYRERLTRMMEVEGAASDFPARHEAWEAVLGAVQRDGTEVRWRFPGAWGLYYELLRDDDPRGGWAMTIHDGPAGARINFTRALGPDDDWHDALQCVRAAWLYKRDGCPDDPDARFVPGTSRWISGVVASKLFDARTRDDPRRADAATEAVRRVMFEVDPGQRPL